MDISVLMSVYKKENAQYFEQSIQSIINQTLKPNQIVIVKDGPLTPELEEVLSKYKNEVETYQKENEGLGKALKFGVEKCKYEYIARMDTDDIAPAYRLEEQAKILKQNPSLDILGGFIEEYDEEMKEFISIREVPLTMEEIKTYIKKQCPFNHTTVIMKKEAILKAGNYSSVQLEDYDLWARMFINGCNMANTNLVLSKSRAGYTLYKRRSGINYIKKIIQIERKLLNYKIINKSTYIKNVLARSIVALLPVKLKKEVYKKIIRKSK